MWLRNTAAAPPVAAGSSSLFISAQPLGRQLAIFPEHSSGFVLIFREPHAEHFMCVEMNGTGLAVRELHRSRFIVSG